MPLVIRDLLRNNFRGEISEFRRRDDFATAKCASRLADKIVE